MPSLWDRYHVVLLCDWVFPEDSARYTAITRLVVTTGGHWKVTHPGEKTQMFRDRKESKRQLVVEMQWKNTEDSYSQLQRSVALVVGARMAPIVSLSAAGGWLKMVMGWWEGDRSLRIPSYVPVVSCIQATERSCRASRSANLSSRDFGGINKVDCAMIGRNWLVLCLS